MRMTTCSMSRPHAMTLMTSVCVHFYVLNGLPHVVDDEKSGLVRDLNPGPLAPKARIIPLDQQATLTVRITICSVPRNL